MKSPFEVDKNGKMKILGQKPIFAKMREKVGFHQNGRILPYFENFYIDQDFQNVWVIGQNSVEMASFPKA